MQDGMQALAAPDRFLRLCGPCPCYGLLGIDDRQYLFMSQTKVRSGNTASIRVSTSALRRTP